MIRLLLLRLSWLLHDPVEPARLTAPTRLVPPGAASDLITTELAGTIKMPPMLIDPIVSTPLPTLVSAPLAASELVIGPPIVSPPEKSILPPPALRIRPRLVTWSLERTTS